MRSVFFIIGTILFFFSSSHAQFQPLEPIGWEKPRMSVFAICADKYSNKIDDRYCKKHFEYSYGKPRFSNDYACWKWAIGLQFGSGSEDFPVKKMDKFYCDKIGKNINLVFQQNLTDY